jgi:CDP-diglyceride synthetase
MTGLMWLVVLSVVAGIATLRAPFMMKRADRLPSLRSYLWLLPMAVIWTGDALVGEGRPGLERIAKGILAAAIWGNFTIVAVRRRRLPKETGPAD